MQTIHLIFGADDFSDFEHGDGPAVCLDLTVEEVGPSLLSEANVAAHKYTFLKAPWQEREHVHSVIRRFMDWYSEIGDAVVGGESLVDTLRVDERLSLWWLTSLSTKHLLRGTTIQLLVFAGYLEKNPELRRRLSSPGQRFQVRGAKPRRQRALRRLIRQLFPSAQFAEKKEAAHKGSRRPYQEKLTMWAYAIRNLAMGGASELRTLARQKSDDSTESCKGEVAICMFPTTWLRAADGTLKNRYWGELPERIAERIGEPTIVPCSQGSIVRKHYVRTVGADTSIDWRSAPDVTPGTTARIIQLLAGMKLRSDRILRELQRRGYTRFGRVEMAEYLKYAVDKILTQGGVEYLYLYYSLRDYFRDYRPKVVLYRNEFYPTGRVVRASLPPETVAIGFQHGIVLPEHTVYSFAKSWLGPQPGAAIDYRWPPMPTKYLVYGDLVRELMSERYDYPKSHIHPAGSPRHDAYFELAMNSPRRVRDRADEPFNLLIPGGLEASTRRWLLLGLRAAELAELPVNVLVKPHWQYPMDRELAKLSREHANLQVIPVGDLLEAWYMKSDAILVETSTTGLEAAIFGVPIISLVREDGSELFPYVEEGAAIGVRTATELSEAIAQCASPSYRDRWEPQRKAFLQRTISPGLGDSVDRMMDAIDSALSKGR